MTAAPRSKGGEASAGPAGPCYLLVFDTATSWLAPLPEQGEASLGSSEAATVRLRSNAVLPAHARIHLGPREAVLTAACAGAPIAVNGERLVGEHVLTSGDVIALGEVTLGFHRNVARAPVRAPLDAAQFRARLDEETERALRYGAPAAVLVIDPGPGAKAELGALASVVCRVARRVDIVGSTGRSELAVLFPATGPTGLLAARRVLAALLELAPAARGGIASCPEDGCDGDALLTGARSAARAGAPASVAAVSSAVSSLSVGENTVLVVDPVMKSLFGLLRQLAASDLPVLVNGETGVGKELVAQALHAWSPRSKNAIVAINCAAVPESLLESELFGHEKGAYSGAVGAAPGLFERAEGGTILLDEVGECSPLTQAKLLRVLETHRVCRVGGLEERKVDFRLVAATNRSLEDEIAKGTFRQDLYYRLSGAAVVVPPLRDRPLDIPVLARAFLDASCARAERPRVSITAAAMQRLAMHAWPGNVRELKHLMVFIAASAPGPELEAEELPPGIAAAAAPWMRARSKELVTPPSPAPLAAAGSADAASPRGPRTLYEEVAELEKRRIEEALSECHGVRVRAAELIGMPLRTFVTKLKGYGLGGREP